MSASNVRAGGAYVEVYATTGRLTVDLARAQAMTAGFANSSRRQLDQWRHAFAAPLSMSHITAPATALGSIGASLTGLAMAGAGLQAGLVLPLAAATNEAVEFQRQMAAVSTMLDDPSLLAGFGEKVRGLSKSLGHGTTDLAGSLRELLGSAIAPADAMGVLETSARMATAGMSDAKSATLLLANNLNAFQLSASQADDVADTLFQTMRYGVITFEELAMHFGMATATAAAAGLSIQEAGAAMATMTRNGLRAELAVTALNGIMAEFLKPSKDGAKVARSFGLELSTATLRSQGLLRTVEDFAALPEDALARIFPDVRGLRGFLAIRGDLKGFQNDMAAMADRGGAMETAYKKMAGTASHSIKQSTQSVGSLAIAVGSQLLPMLGPITAVLRATAHGAEQWAEKNGPLVQQLALVAVAGVAGVGALMALGLTATLAGGGLMALLAPLQFVTAGFAVLIGTAAGLPGLALAFAVVSGAALATAISFGVFDEQAASATEAVSERFVALKTWFGDWGASLHATFDETMGGIVSAAGRGDLQGAFEITMAGVEVAWTDSTARMLSAWHDWTSDIVETFHELKTAMATAILDLEATWSLTWTHMMGEGDTPQARAGETGNNGLWQQWLDVNDKASQMGQYDEGRVGSRMKAKGVEDTYWNRVAERRRYNLDVAGGGKEAEDRARFEKSVNEEIDAKKAARVANRENGVDPFGDRDKAIRADHDAARLERQAERDKALSEAKSRETAAREKLARKLEEESYMKYWSSWSTGDKEKLGVRPGKSKGSGPAFDEGGMEDLEKTRRPQRMGSFSVAELKGMGGVGQMSDKQRARMIALLEVIAKATARRERRFEKVRRELTPDDGSRGTEFVA